jgi:GxxExxY protein
MKEEILTKTIIGCAMKVHSELGPGYVESVYKKSLKHELGKAGLKSQSEQPITVFYDGINVGDFISDMLVEGCVLLELKACLALTRAHEVQLVNYLTATGVDIGLLFNFGSESLQFKRKNRIYQPKTPPEDFSL